MNYLILSNKYNILNIHYLQFLTKGKIGLILVKKHYTAVNKIREIVNDALVLRC